MITELFILKISYYFALLKTKPEELPKLIQNSFVLHKGRRGKERTWFICTAGGLHMSVLRECLSNEWLYALTSRASLVPRHMPVFLHKCSEFKITQLQSNESVNCKEERNSWSIAAVLCAMKGLEKHSVCPLCSSRQELMKYMLQNRCCSGHQYECFTQCQLSLMKMLTVKWKEAKISH